MEMNGSTILTIALILLVIAGIWALIELALTIKAARSTIDDVAGQVSDTITEITPVISKLDGMMDDLDPAIKQIDPVLGKVDTAVDVLTVGLTHLDDVLGDVSSVTGIAGDAAASVSKITEIATTGVVNAIGKLAGIEPKKDESDPSLLTEPAPKAEPAPQKPAAKNAGYIIYPTSTAAEKSEPAASAEAEAATSSADDAGAEGADAASAPKDE